MSRKSLVVFIVAVILFGLSVKIYALVPHFISYQGKLSDESMPLNGEFSMIFRIYDAPTNGTLLWEEYRSVEVIQGIFNVILGEINPLNLLFDQDYWLGMQILPDSEMTPHQRIVSVGHTYMAEDSYFWAGHAPGHGNGLDADTVDGKHADELLDTSSNSQNKLGGLTIGGNVGIGVTSPSEKLEVDGGFKLHPSNGSTFWSERGDSDFDFSQAQGSTKRLMSLHGTKGGGDPLQVWTQNEDGHYVVGLTVQETTGNVGIGTTSPAYKLDVEGNVVRAARNLEFIKHCIKQMPKGKKIKYLRADSAAYKAEIMNFCEGKGILFTIGADLDKSVLAAIEKISEKDWKEFKNGYIAETVHCMNKTENAFRLIVIQRPYQRNLFTEEEPGIKYVAISTNRTESAEYVIGWYTSKR